MMNNSLKQRRRPQARRAQAPNNDKHARAVELLEIMNRQKRGGVEGLTSFAPLLPGVAPGRFAIESHTYSPYGESGGSSLSFPSRYTGQKLDPETRRLLKTDPIGYEDQRNPFAFVGNNPINFFNSFRLDTNPTGGEARGCDGAGCGNFGAAREGNTTHRGVDIAATAGSDVVAPIGGTVRIIHAVYVDDDPDFDGVEIAADDGSSYKLFYVEPSVDDGDVVAEGDIIGTAQDRAGETNMVNHVHAEKRNSDGAVVDPTDELIDD